MIDPNNTYTLTTDVPYGKVRVTPATIDIARARLTAQLRALGYREPAIAAISGLVVDDPKRGPALVEAQAVDMDLYADIEDRGGRTIPVFSRDLPLYDCDYPDCENPVSTPNELCDTHTGGQRREDAAEVRHLQR